MPSTRKTRRKRYRAVEGTVGVDAGRVPVEAGAQEGGVSGPGLTSCSLTALLTDKLLSYCSSCSYCSPLASP